MGMLRDSSHKHATSLVILDKRLRKEVKFVVQVVLDLTPDTNSEQKYLSLSFYQTHKLTVLARVLMFLVSSFQIYQQYSSDIIALIRKPFLIWLDNLFFHPLSWRVLGTQEPADKAWLAIKTYLYFLASIK